MPKFKNIRLKMKGGKSRTQRVRVLASGKYRFVKNLKTSKSTKSKGSKKKTGGRKSMAKKKKRRGGGGRNITATAFKWLRVTSLVGPGAHAAAEGYAHAGVQGAVRDVVRRYSGYDMVTGEFRGDELAKGWGPYIVTSLLTHGVPKITSIIRRL